MCDWSKVKKVLRRGMTILKLYRNGEQLWPLTGEVAWENASGGDISIGLFERLNQENTVISNTLPSVDCYETINGVRTKVTPTVEYSWKLNDSLRYRITSSSSTSEVATVICYIADSSTGSTVLTRTATFTYKGKTKTVSCSCTIYKSAYTGTEPEEPEEPEATIVWENADAGEIYVPRFEQYGERHSTTNARHASIDCYEVVDGVRTKVTPTLEYWWSSSNSSRFSVSNSTSATATITCYINDSLTSSATITRYATFTYNGVSKTVSCNATVYKDAYSQPSEPEPQPVTVKNITLSVDPGSIYDISLSAGGESKNITNKISASCTVTVHFSDGTSTTNYSAYGSLSAPSYSYDMTSKAGFSFSGTQVTAENRGTTEGGKRGTTISRTATFTFTPISGSTISDYSTCTATAEQEANEKSEEYRISNADINYPMLDAASGSQVVPLVSMPEIKKYTTYTSGVEDGGVRVDVNVSAFYSTTSSSMTVNSTTGVVTATSANTSSDDKRLGRVTCVFSYGNASQTAFADVYQSGVVEYHIEITNVKCTPRSTTVNFNYSSNFANKTVTCRLEKFSNGTSETIASGSAFLSGEGTREYTMSHSRLDLSDGVLYIVYISYGTYETYAVADLSA